MTRKFLRQDLKRHSKLGKGRKKMHKWRKPKGRHSKMREKRFGYPLSPSIGFKKPRKEIGKVDGKIPVLVHNVYDLSKVGKNNSVILAKIGAKKKIEVIKLAQEKGIKILNLGEKNNATK